MQCNAMQCNAARANVMWSDAAVVKYSKVHWLAGYTHTAGPGDQGRSHKQEVASANG
jgi:hypothetical protein